MILSSERIGRTAHYTGYVWARNGLSQPELETREGHVLFDSLQPGMLASRAAGSATLEAYLRSRLANILEASITLPSEASTA